MAGQPYVLIVDDEPEFREIFSAKLATQGFRIATAENGQMAIDMMVKEIPDLVLMDVKMPVLDGPSAVLKMRTIPALKDVRVAFLTSLGDPRVEMRDVSQKFAEEFGVQKYLKKTDDLETLGDRVRELLQ